MAKCFACGQRKLFTGPANMAGKQAVRLTGNVKSLLAENELGDLADDPAVVEVVRLGEYYIEELEAVVHRERTFFDFDAHKAWVQLITLQEVALQNALEILRNPPEGETVSPVDALATARVGIFMHLQNTGVPSSPAAQARALMQVHQLNNEAQEPDG
jgi:hypothetical protein